MTRIRPAQPPGLRLVHYAFEGVPAWMPAVPLYAGLPPSTVLPELDRVGQLVNQTHEEKRPLVNNSK